MTKKVETERHYFIHVSEGHSSPQEVHGAAIAGEGGELLLSEASVWPGTFHMVGRRELLEGARQVAWPRTPESPRTLAIPEPAPLLRMLGGVLHPQTGDAGSQELAETFASCDGHD